MDIAESIACKVSRKLQFSKPLGVIEMEGSRKSPKTDALTRPNLFNSTVESQGSMSFYDCAWWLFPLGKSRQMAHRHDASTCSGLRRIGRHPKGPSAACHRRQRCLCSGGPAHGHFALQVVFLGPLQMNPDQKLWMPGARHPVQARRPAWERAWRRAG